MDEKHLFHPYCQALLMLPGMEEKTKQICPDIFQYLTERLPVWRVFLLDAVGLTEALGTLEIRRG